MSNRLTTSALRQKAKKIGNMLIKRKWKLVVAESCSGGLLASTLTDIPGASQWFYGGYVVYTEAMKKNVLAVKATTLKLYGVISEQVAKEMAEGAINLNHADVVIAITGAAGPTHPEKVSIGTVCFGYGSRHNIIMSHTQNWEKHSRATLKKMSVEKAMDLLLYQELV